MGNYQRRARLSRHRRAPAAHEPREQRAAAEADEQTGVAFTSTQALWSACVRAAGQGSDVPAGCPGTSEFYEAHVQPSGLLPVANVYGDARLWANTEWAAWLLLERADFVGSD